MPAKAGPVYCVLSLRAFKFGAAEAIHPFSYNEHLSTPSNFSDPQDVTRHDHMVSMVDQMLTLNKRLQEARPTHEQTLLQRQIEATDRQIDSQVYELYGLTAEEIKIVEGT